MSKLIDQIKTLQTNQKCVIQNNPILIEHSFSEDPFINGTRYRIQAVFGQEVTVPDSIAEQESSNFLDEVLKTTRHSVADAVFGEFKGPLYELARYLSQRGDIRGHKMVYNILQDMFRV